ncbi:MAG: GAF domain-containing protein [Akkermansiaceae bacterium]|nr:GAF domain-containing protein [Akkermansiaceae bacterium]
MSAASHWKERLATILEEFNCQTGTIHRCPPGGKELELVCQIGVPEPVLKKINFIPFGKGIAGAAAEKREPVELCNLQEDLEGVAKPEARQTKVSGSLAVPILSHKEGEVIGTLGVGMHEPHDFSDEEKALLASHASVIARDLELGA